MIFGGTDIDLEKGKHGKGIGTNEGQNTFEMRTGQEIKTMQDRGKES